MMCLVSRFNLHFVQAFELSDGFSFDMKSKHILVYSVGAVFTIVLPLWCSKWLKCLKGLTCLLGSQWLNFPLTLTESCKQMNGKLKQLATSFIPRCSNSVSKSIAKITTGITSLWILIPFSGVKTYLAIK